MKFGVLEIPQDVLLSLRNHNLVVFAGAGVSMGSPSDLPNFIQLAEKIDPTRKVKKGTQIDRFLGVSQRKGVKVYQRANTILSDPASKPNELHKNLIGLFGDPADIRIVTTNFDQHFEESCVLKGWKVPDVYSAPALPLGTAFSGIVHIHGDLTNNLNIVLTDSDFGRAYLTEGWARRFLLDLYNHYSIIFVGYSYEDTIVHYLTHGLTTDISKRRFAICEERDKDKWITYGIQPITYKKTRRKNPYSQLYDGVESFSIRVSRSLLEWRDLINSMAINDPPCSIEDDSQFEQMFLEVETTRLFLNKLTNITWLHWLSQKNLVNCLFSSNILHPVQKELAQWIAETMLWHHPKDVLLLIETNNSINQEFGEILCRTITYSKKHIEKSLLLGFVHILSTNASVNSTSLLHLAEYCLDNNCLEATLEIFLHICKMKINIKQMIDYKINGEPSRLIMEPVFHEDHYRLFNIWNKLKLCLETIHQPILHALLFELESFYINRIAFDPASSDYDFFLFQRLSIEDSSQNIHAKTIDVIIDVIRDTLLWIMRTKPEYLMGWINQLCHSKVQLLIRIAIYIMGRCDTISADERFNWLFNNVDIFNVWYHHEVFSFMQENYRSATDLIRKKLITRINSYRIIDENEVENEERATRIKFDFLSWLLLDVPDCVYAKESITPILSRYPDWQLSQHPDYYVWMGSVRQLGTQSPYSLNELLKMTAVECVSSCVNFPSDDFVEPSRSGLFTEIQKACVADPNWACAVADELIRQNLWDKDFWYAIIDSFITSKWEQSIWLKIYQYLRIDDIFNLDSLFHTITELLLSIVKNGGKSFLPDIIHETDEIAMKLWNTDKINYEMSPDFDIFTQALNHPAGKIALYWFECISISNKNLERDKQAIPVRYRSVLEDALNHGDSKSGCLRSIIMFHSDYLYTVDMNWTKTKLLILLRSKDAVIFSQVWDGFLYCLTNSLLVFPEIHKEFMFACRHIDAFKLSRNRFVELLTYFIMYSKTKPVSELMSIFYENSNEEDRVTFLHTIRVYLKNSQANSLDVFWQSWLEEYLLCRLDNLYYCLSSKEIIEVFNWLPYLPAHFPDLVKYITKTEPIEKLDFHYLLDIADIPYIKSYPIEVAQLIIFLCKNALYLFQKSSITELAKDISDVLSVEMLVALKEALISRDIYMD